MAVGDSGIFFDRFVAISDLYEPTDDGTESQVRDFVLICICKSNELFSK